MFERLEIPEVFVFTPRRRGDARGWFAETFNFSVFSELTGPLNWVQDNQSYSAARGVLRGLHYQSPPYAQDKLVRCLSGKVLDVAVDIRHGSPTFGRHVKTVLDADLGNQIFVPKGFAHGCVSLTPGCEIFYKVSDFYSPNHDHGLIWDDPTLSIDWEMGPETPKLSDRDKTHPRLSDMPRWFTYRG